MPSYTQEQIEEQFQRLPEALKNQMISAENSQRMFEIGKKFGLTLEYIGFLAQESGYVVLGLTHPKDFVLRLKDRLRIDDQKAKMIAGEINRQIFFPFREALKSAHQFEITQEEIMRPPMAQAPRLSRAPSSAEPSAAIPLSAVSSKPAVISAPSPASGASMPRAPIPTASVSPTPQPITRPPISPTLAQATQEIPPPLSKLTPSSIQEKKTEYQSSELTPGVLSTSKSADGIKSKETASPSAVPPAPIFPLREVTAGQAPPSPSQVMQEKLLEEKKSASPPSLQTEIDRMKESLFAPASVPSLHETEKGRIPSAPLPPQSIPPVTSPQTTASPTSSRPSFYSSKDPYREPTE